MKFLPTLKRALVALLFITMTAQAAFAFSVSTRMQLQLENSLSGSDMQCSPSHIMQAAKYNNQPASMMKHDMQDQGDEHNQSQNHDDCCNSCSFCQMVLSVMSPPVPYIFGYKQNRFSSPVYRLTATSFSPEYRPPRLV